MKKIICMIMAVIMVFGLVACGNNNTNPTTPDETPTTNQPEDNNETTVTPDDNAGENTNIETQPVEEINGFTYAEELAVALISQTGATAPVATERLDLVDATSIKDATGIEDLAKIKNVSVTTSFDESKVFELVVVIFTDEASATNGAETMKNTLSALGDDSASVAVKNYAIAVVMNAADSDTISAQSICDKFNEMVTNEADIYFPTRHLDEEPPVEEETGESDDTNEETEPGTTETVDDGTTTDTIPDEANDAEG